MLNIMTCVVLLVKYLLEGISNSYDINTVWYCNYNDVQQLVYPKATTLDI